MAQTEGWRSVKFSGLNGGLNDAGDVTNLEANEAVDIQNVIFETLGGLRRRDGFTEINTTVYGDTFPGVAFYKQADGTRFLVGVNSDSSGDTIRKMDYGAGTTGPDGTWDDITGALNPAVDDDDLSDFAVAEDIIVIEDGVNTTAPYKWSGSGNAAALGGSPQNASMVEYHKRHLWLAGNDSNPSRVYFSNLDDIETWTGTDTVDVETDDGQIITGLASGLDCLYVFKNLSIWRICGTNRDDFVLEQMVRGIGAANNNAIVFINNQFVFMTSQGDVAVYDGGLNIEIISSKIDDTLDGLEFSRIDKTVAVEFEDNFYACVTSSGDTEHSIVLLFDTFHQAWTKFSGINCNALAVYEIGTQERAIAFADYSGQVHRYPNGNDDNGASINAFYASGHYDFDVHSQKIFRLMQAIFEQRSTSHPVAIQYRINFLATGPEEELDLSSSGAEWDSAVYDVDSYGDVSTELFNIHIDSGEGNFIQWYISEDSLSSAFLLRNLRIWYEDTGRVQ